MILQAELLHIQSQETNKRFWIMGLISFIEVKILDSNEELKFSIERIYYEKYFNRSKTNISTPNVIDFNLHPHL